MVALILFCILPIILLCIASIGASVIQIAFNSIDDKELNDRMDNLND